MIFCIISSSWLGKPKNCFQCATVLCELLAFCPLLTSVSIFKINLAQLHIPLLPLTLILFLFLFFLYYIFILFIYIYLRCAFTLRVLLCALCWELLNRISLCLHNGNKDSWFLFHMRTTNLKTHTSYFIFSVWFDSFVYLPILEHDE